MRPATACERAPLPGRLLQFLPGSAREGAEMDNPKLTLDPGIWLGLSRTFASARRANAPLDL